MIGRLALVVIFMSVLAGVEVYGQPAESSQLINDQNNGGPRTATAQPGQQGQSGLSNQPGPEGNNIEQQGVGTGAGSTTEPISVIDLKDGLLSVGLTNAPFGKVMSEIANRAGFELYTSDDVYDRTVTTSFEEVELERGILRLLGLIGQKTYFFYYNPDGSFKKLEIFGLGPGESPRQKPAPTPRPSRLPSRQMVTPPQVERSFPAPRMPARPRTGGRTPYSPPPSDPGEPSFIPPREAPVYVPPTPQRGR